MRAYRALQQEERWENPRAWLYRVASHLATDDYRRRRLFGWLPLWESDGQEEGPEEAVVERMAVRRALRALPPRYRVPLVLYTYREWSVAEVAETLELSESAVKMRLCRAREMFRTFYEGEEEG